jgi:anti-sigma factor RsiW
MIFARHPRADLALAAEGRLDPAARLRLDAHLARCARCRAALEASERAVAALRPAPGGAPADLRARLVAAARADLPPRRTSVPLSARLAGAAAAAVALVAAALLAVVPARVRVVAAGDAVSPFERTAAEAHAALRTDVAPLDLASGDAAAIRAWLRDEGLSADLASERPAADAAHYRLLGARRAGDGVRPAAAIATRIDGAAVTLLVGREADVEEIPAWGWVGKRLLVRRDPATGTHLLSWRNAGKAYTLVTDPGVAPARACQLCHVDDRRRRAIAKVAEQL